MEWKYNPELVPDTCMFFIIWSAMTTFFFVYWFKIANLFPNTRVHYYLIG